MTTLKTHYQVVWPKNIAYVFFGLNQCVIMQYLEHTIKIEKEKSLVFEKIKVKSFSHVLIWKWELHMQKLTKTSNSNISKTTYTLK